jgi:hypothetical protein
MSIINTSIYIPRMSVNHTEDIHQDVENGRHLEELIEAPAIKIEKFERKLEGTNGRHLERLIEAQAIKIEELERKLDGTNDRHLERLIETQAIKIEELEGTIIVFVIKIIFVIIILFLSIIYIALKNS